MASTWFTKGALFALIVGLLLPSILVSGQGTNGTTPSSNSTMTGTAPTPGTSMLYCPSFMCNDSNCYSMYNSQNATACAAGAQYCQLCRMSTYYVANCSMSCMPACFNASQTNCCVGCCNSTGCLNSTFASMMMMTTTMMTTNQSTTQAPTTVQVTTGTTTVPQTTDNSNKCHVGTCNTQDCYKDFSNAQLQTCTSAQFHCQLMQGKDGNKDQWTAGCTTNCSTQPVCKGSTASPCHLECCTATTTSCLWLNGTRNVFSHAPRGQILNNGLIALLVCIIAIAWMI